jgi:hypothetical protein
MQLTVTNSRPFRTVGIRRRAAAVATSFRIRVGSRRLGLQFSYVDETISSRYSCKISTIYYSPE